MRGCAALRRWAHSDAADLEVLISQKGGIEAIMTAMNAHKRESRLQEHACAGVSVLAYNKENQVMIRETGVLCMQSMRTGTRSTCKCTGV